MMDGVTAFIFSAIAGCFLLIIGLAYYDVKKWEEYAAAHNCKQFGYIGPSTGTGIGFDGKVTFVTIPSKTGYRCDNGKEFWR